jgi:hypothetical protein
MSEVSAFLQKDKKKSRVHKDSEERMGEVLVFYDIHL